MGSKIAPQPRTAERPLTPTGRKSASSVESLSPASRLQSAIGNAATARLLRSGCIQTKPTVSRSEDASEREADRLADQVMRMPDPPPDAPQSGKSASSQLPHANASRKVQRKCDHCQDEEDKLQRKEQGSNPSNTAAAPPIAHEALRSMGQPLDSPTRGFFERRFGRDFSQVRVHTGALQTEAAQAVNALAYTVGSNIVFGKGRYSPGQQEGRRLLAHELAHVMQQSEAMSPRLQKFEAPVHESVERYGLTTDASGKGAGLSQKEATAVYFGNWMRDMNQVFVPMVINLVKPENIDVIYAAINYLALEKFGAAVNAKQFGYYIPSEHIDNPAGIVAEYDLLPGPPAPTISSAGSAAPTGSKDDTPKESPDPKTGDVLGANIFSVDKSGVMAFILRSNLHVERRLDLAAELGRRPEGFMHFGAALHAVEDLFAHSNWIEIAVSKTLAEDPKLLPQLKKSEREVFTFSNQVKTPKKGKRPVLTTGSFTGKDTKISIGSEVVAVLDRGLSEPASEAEQVAQEQLTLEMLRATSGKARTDPKFRAEVRKVILNNVPPIHYHGVNLVEGIVDELLKLPMEEIYKLTLLLSRVPKEIQKLIGVAEIQKAIRSLISQFVMKPISGQLQTLALETQVSDTSLLKNLEENRAAVAASNQAAVEKTPEEKAAAEEPQKRVTALEATPEEVLAGPSHSQLSKDHPNSPFFGLAFLLATIAVRSLREKMVAAWDEKIGKATTEYQFNASPTDPKEKALYDLREKKSLESFERGKGVVKEARDTSKEGGEMSEKSFDLAAMRNESANEIRSVAAALRSVASAPGELGNSMKSLSRRLGGVNLGPLAAEIKKSRSFLTPTTIDTSGALTTHATVLDGIANEVQGQPGRSLTHDEREAANLKLQQQKLAFHSLVLHDHSIDAAFGAAILMILQRQVQYTAVSWTKDQRDVLEGRRHVLADKNLHSLKVDQNLELPSVDKKTPAVQALVKESRKFMGHPYDNDDWWKPTVKDFITKHASQMQSEIEARNAGYLVFRTPGKKDSH